MLARFLFAAAAVASFAFLLYLAAPKNAETAPVAFFAYGANLEIGTMRARAGGAENATPAVLQGYRLVFQTNRDSEFGVANAIPDQPSFVAGAIYLLTPEQEKELDRASGVPGFYQKATVMARQKDGAEVPAVTYILSGSPSFAPPSRPTLLAASKGLQQFGYDQSAQDALAAAASEAQQKSGRGN